jgi:hypothetical protein
MFAVNKDEVTKIEDDMNETQKKAEALEKGKFEYI